MKKKTMKIRPLILLVALLTALSSFALGQHKHMQMMEMMKDSVMMDLLMDHIASNNQMHATMMKKMIYYAVGDTMKMTEMCRAMIDDKRMLRIVLEMLEDTKKEKSNHQHNQQ